MSNKGFSVKIVLKSFKFAFRGLRVLFREEHNAWVHLAVTLMVILAGVVLHVSLLEWGLLAFAIGAVFAAETFNSALERICDILQPAQDKRIGDIKDLCAAAVLICAITAATIGLLVFLPKIF
jgi:diacylglycerol kinase (ATP)